MPLGPGVSEPAKAAKAASPGFRMTRGSPLICGKESSAPAFWATIVSPAGVTATTVGQPWSWQDTELVLTNFSQAPIVPAAAELLIKVIPSCVVEQGLAGPVGAGGAELDVLAAGLAVVAITELEGEGLTTPTLAPHPLTKSDRATKAKVRSRRARGRVTV